MYEYEIVNIDTGKESIIFGYTLEDALRRYKMEGQVVKILHKAYID